MSAFIVPEEHIRFLVQAGLDLGQREKLRWDWGNDSCAELDDLTMDRVGQMLTNENYRSCNARYGGEFGQAPRYVHRLWHGYMDPVRVLKAINCYEYQACESDDWKETEAHAFCESLRHWAIDALPGYRAMKDAWPVYKLPESLLRIV